MTTTGKESGITNGVVRWTLGAVAVAIVGVFHLGPGWVAGHLNPRFPLEPLPDGVLEEAGAILGEHPVVDLHSDALLWDRDLSRRGERGHVDLPRLAEGQVAVQMFTAVTRVPRGTSLTENADDSDLITPLALLQLWPPATWSSALERALHQADKLRTLAARSGGGLSVLTTRDQLDTFLRGRRGDEGTVGALLGVEGAHALEGRLANLDVLHDAGFRMMGLTHFFDNEVGGSAHGLAKGGLTELGEQVVTRMGELGMLVDLAHASPALIDDVTRTAAGPVVVSHTGVFATCPSPRNLPDEALRRIAATGGVVGIGLWPEALCGETPAHWAAAVRHAVTVVGAAHVVRTGTGPCLRWWTHPAHPGSSQRFARKAFFRRTSRPSWEATPFAFSATRCPLANRRPLHGDLHHDRERPAAIHGNRSRTRGSALDQARPARSHGPRRPRPAHRGARGGDRRESREEPPPGDPHRA